MTKKGKHSSSEVNWQAEKSCYRMRQNLSSAFGCFPAEERLGMKSDAKLTCFMLDRAVSLLACNIPT